MSLNINSQITRFRKLKNLTQEDLAKAVGVTNQAVSKWESGICCPDIQLLPVLANIFDISIDELIGVPQTKSPSLESVCNEISSLLNRCPSSERLSLAFKLSANIHNTLIEDKSCMGCVTLRFNSDNNAILDDSIGKKFGSTICSEPNGETAFISNSIFLTDHDYWNEISNADIRTISHNLKKYSDQAVIKVMYAIYELTISKFDLFVSVNEICDKCGLQEESVRSAMENLDLQIEETDGMERYRLSGAIMYIPPLLRMLSDEL